MSKQRGFFIKVFSLKQLDLLTIFNPFEKSHFYFAQKIHWAVNLFRGSVILKTIVFRYTPSKGFTSRPDHRLLFFTSWLTSLPPPPPSTGCLLATHQLARPAACFIWSFYHIIRLSVSLPLLPGHLHSSLPPFYLCHQPDGPSLLLPPSNHVSSLPQHFTWPLCYLNLGVLAGQRCCGEGGSS